MHCRGSPAPVLPPNLISEGYFCPREFIFSWPVVAQIQALSSPAKPCIAQTVYVQYLVRKKNITRPHDHVGPAGSNHSRSSINLASIDAAP